MRRGALGALGAAGAAAGFAWYHGQSPTSQLYGPTICRVPGAGKLVALTYDDGPNPRHTPELIELFARHGARATFFLVGRWAEREPALVRELAEAGHAIGNHTHTHPTMPVKGAAEVREELGRCREAIGAAGVEATRLDGATLMRPPYGRRRPGTLRVLRREGYVPVLWSITCWDWRERETAQTIAGRAARARDGDLVLLHDGDYRVPEGDRAASVAATAKTLERLGAEGYGFVTVPELVAAGRANAVRPGAER
ncbi:MAG: polysaccharide deacetylase family protein [Solirubrobacterales bacterium]